MTFEVCLEPAGVVFPAQSGETILTAALQAGLPLLVSPCGGHGTCGKCHIRVLSGNVAPPDKDEKERLGAKNLKNGIRLACRTYPLSDIRLNIPARSRSAIGYSLFKEPRSQPPLTPVYRDALRRKGYGIAIDLGTSTVTAQLVDLASGLILAKEWLPNPQRQYGDDVMTRLTLAEHGSAENLRRCITEALNRLISGLARGHEISNICIASNTVMHHLLLGLPVTQLGRAPYLPYTKQAITVTATDLGLTAAPESDVYLMPLIGGFVGGDHTAALLATGMNYAAGNILLLDIGTNTEVSLAVKGTIRCVSCASGPAFEGAALQHGMFATDGAIESVAIGSHGLKVGVIGNIRPLGICGSGIIDALYHMRQRGIIDRRGRLRQGNRVRLGRHGPEFILVSRRDSGTGEEITITQEDIGKVQLGKAAIRTGIEVLMATCGLSHEQIDQVIIAGSFGTYINSKSAVGIGLLPGIPETLITQVGNAAVVGARMAMLIADRHESIQRLASSVRHIELAQFPQFKSIFSRALAIDGPSTLSTQKARTMHIMLV